MLECVECGGRTKEFELGWAAVRVDDPDGESPPEVAVYCARCFAREFGGLRSWLEPQRPADA